MATNYEHVLYFTFVLRSGNEEKILSLLTPLNVNCHASDGRKSTPLHLAAGYNRTRIVKLLLQHGADVHAKVLHVLKNLEIRSREKNIERLCNLFSSFIPKGYNF